MRVRSSASLFSCLLCATLGALATGIAAPVAAAQSDTIYPQTVRLSSVAGDVRIARGKSAQRADKDEPGARTGWEQAVSGLPLEAGFSLVTAQGNAEIELENASTLYLAPNSVLTLDSLQSQNSVTYTEVSLLSGSLLINSRPQAAGDSIRLNTPTDHLTVGYPGSAVWRVDSYLDAIAITRLEGTPPTQRYANAVSTPLGRTMTYAHGRPVIAPETQSVPALAAWQSSALSRIEARQAALTTAMEQAGLTQPLPGLDQLATSGTFFSCAPYGTCWAPTSGWDGKAANDVSTKDTSADALKKWTVSVKDVANPGAQPPAGGIPSKTGQPTRVDAYLLQHPGATFYTDDYVFPCSISPVRELIAVDPVTGKETLVTSQFDGSLMDPFMMAFPHRPTSFFGYDAFWMYNRWDWTVCHAGAWIRWNHRYVWVASNHRHHHCPVRWVHNGHHEGYVPIHPRDVAGKPPINLKDGLFHLDGKHSTVERVNFEPDRQSRLLAEPPREFRSPPFAALKIADTPHAEAHSAWASEYAALAAHGVPSAAAPVARGTAIVSPAAGLRHPAEAHREVTEAHHEGVPISFDRKSQSFSVSREVSSGGGHSTTVSTQIGGGRAFGPTGSGGWNNTHAGSYSGGGGSQARGGGGNSGGSYSGGGSQARGAGGNSGASASRGSSPSSGGGNSGGGAPRGGSGGSSGGGGGGGGASHSSEGGGGATSGGGGSSGGHK